MKRQILALAVVATATLLANAQAPEESEDVMLQGFYWDSQKATSWVKLTNMADDIGRSFTMIWLPPSASAEGGNEVGGNNVGYHPKQWNDQNSCWGTAEQLKTLISTLHENGVKVVADIVINHRAGNTDWGNFTKDDFGEYGVYQLTADHICSTDEMNTDPNAGSWNGKATGAAETDPDSNWGGARDLDHSNAYVQADCKAYLNWLKGEFGYDGWRYDYCKGFRGQYVGIYNESSKPYLSVGEYWDGEYDKVAAWIEATGKQSTAFDFPGKYAALNNGLAAGNFSSMSWKENYVTPRPAGMIHHANFNRYAVTFVDNHDTYRDGSKYTGDVLQAYAYLLSAPGIPCVFWPHWKNVSWKGSIEKMIKARKDAGITSQSDVEVTACDKYYECIAKGKKRDLICRIGAKAPNTVPEGYEKVCAGDGWTYYMSINSNATRLPKADLDEDKKVEIYRLDGRLIEKTTVGKMNAVKTRGMCIVRVGGKSYKTVIK
ncbi:MAG: alpha-amylase [Bacteroidales bacterium]|nr:alpha-amylase [Bacteroidales bacterium]